jgi:hypothetical protein
MVPWSMCKANMDPTKFGFRFRWVWLVWLVVCVTGKQSSRNRDAYFRRRDAETIGLDWVEVALGRRRATFDWSPGLVL